MSVNNSKLNYFGSSIMYKKIIIKMFDENSIQASMVIRVFELH